MRRICLSVVVAVAAATACAGGATEWPQWRGPKRDALCTDKGLLTEWPEGGPKLQWTIRGLGRGYASVAIAKLRLYTMGDRRPSGGSGRNEAQYALCYDLRTHKPVWATRVGSSHRSGGPRCTPTVDGDLVYTVGPHGNITCLSAASGRIRWQRNFPKDFGGKMSTMWKFSESPLIDGSRVICTPGSQRAMLAALDKRTGKPAWACAVPDLGSRGRDGAAYASAMVSEACGVRQYVQLVGKGLIGVRARDGKLLWHYNRIANSTANCPTPVVRGDYVFCTTSYSTGAVLLKLTKAGAGIEPKEVYFLGPRTFENIHGGVVLVGDYIYSAKGHKYNHEPICIEFLTGKVAWKAPKALGRLSATTLYADGHLYHRYEDGVMALVEATPEAYRLKSVWKPESRSHGPTWAHPVIFSGRLFLRHDDELACYDIRAQ